MSTVASPTRYTPEDLLTMPDGNRFELENGQLVERDVSIYSSFVGGVIYALMAAYCQKTRRGWPFPADNTYQCFPDDPERVRKADVSFIRRDRLSLAQLTAKGHCRVAPDLAVEVLSPNDIAYEVDEKVQLWIASGVLRVWIVNPAQRTLEIHRAAGTGVILHETDEVSDEAILPEFRCRVADFFQLNEKPLNAE